MKYKTQQHNKHSAKNIDIECKSTSAPTSKPPPRPAMPIAEGADHSANNV